MRLKQEIATEVLLQKAVQSEKDEQNFHFLRTICTKTGLTCYIKYLDSLHRQC